MGETITLNIHQEAVEQWLKDNPDRTLADCTAEDRVTLSNGKTINLKAYLNRIRHIYKVMQQGKQYATYKNLTEEEIKWWTYHGMIWNINCKTMYQEAVEQWLEDNPDKTLVDCTVEDRITLSNGKTINLKEYLNRLRKIYKAMRQGKKYKRYKSLTEEEIKWWTDHGINWEIKIKTDTATYQEAVEQWLKDNPNKTLADCTAEDRITLSNGKTINLKEYLNRLRKIYKAMQKGKQYRDYKNLTEEEIKWWTDHGMNWDLKSNTETNKKNKDQLVEKYVDLTSGDIEKARKVVTRLTMLKTKRQTQVWTVNNIMKKFQIDFINLQYCFEKCKENLSLSAPNQTMYQNQTLKQLCTENSYNYEIIKYALRLSKFYEQDTLEQIIERAIESYRYKDQESVAPWIYEKYGEDIIDILKLLNVNSNSVIKNMNKYVICIEESLQHEAFKISKKRKNEVWLEVLYNYIIEKKIDIKNDKNQVVNDLVMASQEIARDYQLTNEELATLAQSLSNYLKIMKQYQMVNIELGTKSDEKGRQKVKTSGQ